MPGFYAGASLIYGTPGLIENGGIPNITGTFRGGRNYGGTPAQDCTGAFWLQGSTYNPKGSDSSGAGMLIGFQASRISSVYNNSTKVYASGLKIYFAIKY